MNELKIIGRGTFIFALALGTAGTGWATLTGCATASPGSSLTTLALTAGCFLDDQSYTNLTLTGTGRSGNGTAPTSGAIDLYAMGTAASGNAVGPESFLVDGFTSITATGSETGTVNAQVTANTGSLAGVTYPAPANLALHWAYATLTLAPTVGSISGGDTVTITENFCLSATQSTTGGTCNAADQGTITAKYTGNTTAAYTCTFGTTGICVNAASNEVDFSTLTFAPTTIATSTQVTLNRVAGGGTLTLTNFEDTFGEIAVGPEPASWGMMGAALAGLVAIGWRKRRLQA